MKYVTHIETADTFYESTESIEVYSEKGTEKENTEMQKSKNRKIEKFKVGIENKEDTVV